MGGSLSAVKSYLVHAVAVLVMVLTYALGSAGTQLLSVAGLSGLALVTTATPANAQRRWRASALSPALSPPVVFAAPVLVELPLLSGHKRGWVKRSRERSARACAQRASAKNERAQACAAFYWALPPPPRGGFFVRPSDSAPPAAEMRA